MARVIVISIDGLAWFYWTDPKARMPTLRRLAAEGTIARGMEGVFPSTTWPSHTTLVTGVSPERHGVVANSILNRATGRPEDFTGDPIHDAADLLRAPTIHDVAHAAGRATAAIDWPATRRAASLGFNLPFFKDQRVFREHTSPAVWAELEALGYPVERMGEWTEQSRRFFKDAMVGELAVHVWTRHAPDLLLVHFLCTDSFQHLWGPRSPEAYWAIQYVDDRIGSFLASLPPGEVPERTTVIVVSDHGFFPVEREIRPNVRLRALRLLEANDQGDVTRASARFVSNGGGGLVYLLGNRSPGLATELAAELGKLPGVAGAWADAHRELGLPAPDANPRVGDVIFETEPGWMFVNDAVADETGPTRRYRGTHGQRPSRKENHAFFLAAGAGITRGVEVDPIRHVDVAPTLARLLGVEMPNVEGRVLTEILA